MITWRELHLFIEFELWLLHHEQQTKGECYERLRNLGLSPFLCHAFSE